MTNLYIIENKIEAIKKNLKLLKEFRKYSAEVLKSETILNGAVKWYLYLVIQDTISLAEAVIAYKNLRKPTSYRESFYILREEKIISFDLQEALIKMSGFRNLIIHEYDKIDFRKVVETLKNDLRDIEQFLKSITVKLKI